jgi:hypothetical protein
VIIITGKQETEAIAAQRGVSVAPRVVARVERAFFVHVDGVFLRQSRIS